MTNVNNSDTVSVRVPKRVLHFSDGTLEEYSDNESSEPKEIIQNTVNPKNLAWLPWFRHYTWVTGNKTLQYCDYMGEVLADFLGITTPKYQLELSEYQRNEEEKQKTREESSGWVPINGEGAIPLVTNPPSRSGDPSVA